MPAKRNIVLWYVLMVVTFGIGALVWYYLINRDAKTLARNDTWSPAMSVVAVTIGAVIIVPPFVSVWRTWSRVREATNAEGMGRGLQFCLAYLPIVHFAYYGYLQSKLNAAADARAIRSEPFAAAV
jgi:Domain of unknown function (DUF4234)